MNFARYMLKHVHVIYLWKYIDILIRLSDIYFEHHPLKLPKYDFISILKINIGHNQICPFEYNQLNLATERYKTKLVFPLGMEVTEASLMGILMPCLNCHGQYLDFFLGS